MRYFLTKASSIYHHLKVEDYVLVVDSVWDKRRGAPTTENNTLESEMLPANMAASRRQRYRSREKFAFKAASFPPEFAVFAQYSPGLNSDGVTDMGFKQRMWFDDLRAAQLMPEQNMENFRGKSYLRFLLT